MTGAANYYIANSKPSAEPIVFSDTTKQNFKRIHNISGTAVKVTSKTTGLIHQTVEKLADRVAGKGKGTPGEGQHSVQSGLRPGAMTGIPYGSSSSFPTPISGKNSSTWPSQYSGRTLHPSSNSSFAPPPYEPSPSPTPGTTPPPLPRRKLLNRLLTSTDMLLTTLESSAHHLVSTTTTSLSAAATHKYGHEAGQAVGMMGDSVKNVGVVYIDMKGVGRRALLKVAGKRVVKARMGGKEVVFQDQGMGKGQVVANGTPVTGPGGSDTYAPPPFPPPRRPATQDLERKG